ncbi:MAG: DJ-1/PfpI family protein [Bacteroidales bacterium]|jgi:4-methyl-5(b-hydroxyethyl)-thiazole monophosphate biosynthesis|nr:DJ-1/PfpI family protein [Bacteroidales bacterium]MBR4677969.1 DJ-1/PfpI family protein [Bacteroidales bacterium]MEE3447719.1 DJ-1 family glyoxalase III [Bacteroidales bacterium]
MKKVYIFLAEGFETIEALGAYDVFCRGGLDVKTVSINNKKQVSASNKIKVEADKLILEIKDFSDADLLYLPGGYPGYENLAKDATVGSIIKKHYEEGKLLAAICGAPTVLLKNRIGFGKKVTSHSCCKDEMSANYVYTGKPVEEDGNILTSIGAGHSVDFAIRLVEILEGEKAVEKIKSGMEL